MIQAGQVNATVPDQASYSGNLSSLLNPLSQAASDVTVTLSPEVRRLDDIVPPADNATRAKRARPQPSSTALARNRRLNRVKAGRAGSDQSSPAEPLLCGTSTEVKERSAQTVQTSDQRARFRRVEVWIVPGGAAVPDVVTGLQDVPAAEVKKLGCPKQGANLVWARVLCHQDICTCRIPSELNPGPVSSRRAFWRAAPRLRAGTMPNGERTADSDRSQSQSQPQRSDSWRSVPQRSDSRRGGLVDGMGFEPTTPALRTPCSPN
jgi:hypothetical protein